MCVGGQKCRNVKGREIGVSTRVGLEMKRIEEEERQRQEKRVDDETEEEIIGIYNWGNMKKCKKEKGVKGRGQTKGLKRWTK